MTNSTPENEPEITIFFSIGIIGMDEPVTEYITLPIAANDDTFTKELQLKSQLAQLKLQVGFLELMTTRFPKWVVEKFAAEGWELPDRFLE